MSDTRAEATRWMSISFQRHRTALKIIASLAIALLVSFWPDYLGLPDSGRSALFILLLATGLWSTEALPAFAVGLLVIGLSIAILGKPGGDAAASDGDWERFLVVWGSPLIWLFFGGFVLAAAAEKVELTGWVARNVLQRFGDRASLQLLGCLLVAFVFSMFISNTATATMMIAIAVPLLRSSNAGPRYEQGYLLGIACAANLGGMGSLIGSPPNAIAAGALADVQPIDFARWMFVGLPPALTMLVIVWLYLIWRYPAETTTLQWTEQPIRAPLEEGQNRKLQRSRWAVVSVFSVTVAMWMTSSLHGIPSTVVALIPTCCLTAIGVIDSQDIRELPWDVLLLIAGGLALGVAVTDTGLANWLVDQLPLDGASLIGIAIAFCLVAIVLSNIMSNTAASNILIPIALAVSPQSPSIAVIPIALGASAAMCLPISTPPNAVVYGTGRIRTRDMLESGLLIAFTIPPIILLWCWLVIG